MSALYNSAGQSGGESGGGQQQYCLKWNNHTNNMVKVFNELLGDENFVDVTLSCDGVNIKAHKLVLSACSSYFRDLLINNPCKHPIVILTNIHYEDLQAIIHFMYSGEVNVSYTQLGPLLKTAEALKVKGLTDVNEKHGNAFLNGAMAAAAAAAAGALSAASPTDHQHSTSNAFTNGTSPQNDPMTNLYNRMALESLANQSMATAEPSSAYLAFMAQRFKKRRRKHKNGSALALANVLNAANGSSSLQHSLSASTTANGFSSVNNKITAANNSTTKFSGHHKSNHLHEQTNGNGTIETDAGGQSNQSQCLPVAQDSGDESVCSSSAAPVTTIKRHKATNNVESSDSFNDVSHRTSSPLNGLNTQDDDDDDVNGTSNVANGDTASNADQENADSMAAQDSLIMSMNDSDDEFYPDVKPIVSLDESPSPTNSTMDDNSSFNSSSFAAAVGPILENSLTGSNLPNNSTKVCVCHLCHLTFTAYSSLRRHMTRHYADRERYECDICLKSYSRKDYLKEHKKLKHSDVAKVMSAQRNKQAAQAGSVS